MTDTTHFAEAWERLKTMAAESAEIKMLPVKQVDDLCLYEYTTPNGQKYIAAEALSHHDRKTALMLMESDWERRKI